MLEHMILGIIFERNATGYDIKKVIETKICMFYKPSFGSLYPALKRLVQKGEVSTYEELQGARKKVFYQITAAGKESFLQWLSLPLDINDGSDKNLVKIYFYDLLPVEIQKEQLLKYENSCRQYLESLELLEKELRNIVNQEKYYYKFSTLFYGISVTKATLAWCKTIREKLELTTLL